MLGFIGVFQEIFVTRILIKLYRVNIQIVGQLRIIEILFKALIFTKWATLGGPARYQHPHYTSLEGRILSMPRAFGRLISRFILSGLSECNTI
jgi:hypothetical protein